jgi:hypothetical protein
MYRPDGACHGDRTFRHVSDREARGSKSVWYAQRNRREGAGPSPTRPEPINVQKSAQNGGFQILNSHNVDYGIFSATLKRRANYRLKSTRLDLVVLDFVHQMMATGASSQRHGWVPIVLNLQTRNACTILW